MAPEKVKEVSTKAQASDALDTPIPLMIWPQIELSSSEVWLLGQEITGLMVSRTVKSKVHEFWLLLSSVTVRITGNVPVWMQLNTLKSKVRSEILQLSVLALSTSPTFIELTPAAFK